MSIDYNEAYSILSHACFGEASQAQLRQVRKFIAETQDTLVALRAKLADVENPPKPEAVRGAVGCICGHLRIEHEPDCVYCGCRAYVPYRDAAAGEKGE